MSSAGPVLWVEPRLGTISGGLRYNQQLRAALAARGVTVETLRLPPERFRNGSGQRTVEQARARLAPALLVVDGLIGSAHPELFEESLLSGQTVLLIHLPLAAALAAEGVGDPDAVTREKWAVLEADHVVTVSRWGAGELRRRYRRQNIAVAHPGSSVEVTPRSPDPSPNRTALRDNYTGFSHLHRHITRCLHEKEVYFVAAATLNPVKNHTLLGQALEPLLDLDWQLVLAGPGADSEFGQQILRDLQGRLPGRVEHRGVLDSEQMGALWAEADLLLLPSLVETYGMVVTEACAHGVPAFVSAGTGAEEAAGEAGIPLDPQESAAWTARLRRFLEEPEDRAELRETALRRRRTLPTWEEAAQVFATLS
ncbi:glycosyltransferase family 4 protein [Nesterenkonia ebinurensis]|uniref:glycosyltransferase family 4 protein n=1 Tax=Nesterenkonia ebinurensis TaxID=2608252 RepID=UPI00123D79CB|nr:glycosyltransferase family 4 protein [Nesterenkonia ebinurensis]